MPPYACQTEATILLEDLTVRTVSIVVMIFTVWMVGLQCVVAGEGMPSLRLSCRAPEAMTAGDATIVELVLDNEGENPFRVDIPYPTGITLRMRSPDQPNDLHAVQWFPPRIRRPSGLVFPLKPRERCSFPAVILWEFGGARPGPIIKERGEYTFEYVVRMRDGTEVSSPTLKRTIDKLPPDDAQEQSAYLALKDPEVLQLHSLLLLCTGMAAQAMASPNPDPAVLQSLRVLSEKKGTNLSLLANHVLACVSFFELGRTCRQVGVWGEGLRGNVIYEDILARTNACEAQGSSLPRIMASQQMLWRGHTLLMGREDAKGFACLEAVVGDSAGDEWCRGEAKNSLQGWKKLMEKASPGGN